MSRGALLVLSLVAVFATGSRSQTIPQAAGAVAAWEKILKLRTTASVMHITAHPDDEHGGVLAKLSRGDGARVALLTLNRGESGDNAIGPQLFDALGLIRTEELLQANRYYGVDEQYFTTVVDYGFSKRLEESLDQWGRDTVLRDVVRIIRMSRPTIVLSRFQGNERDGHGNHQAAGLMAVEAFRAAGDPSRFPEQIADGLRTWQPKRLFVGVREADDWTVRIATGDHHALIGDSYENIARYGLSFQRSQNGGRFAPVAGPAYGYFKLVAGQPLDPKGDDLFAGIPTSVEAAVGPAGREVDETIDQVTDTPALFPATAVASLVSGLRAIRYAVSLTQDPEALHVLKIKDAQFQDAINASLGLSLTAFTNPPFLTAPVAGQKVAVDVALSLPASYPRWEDPDLLVEGLPGWSVESPVQATLQTFGDRQSIRESFRVTLADDVPVSTKPYFTRRSLQDSVYTLSDPAMFGRPASPAPLVAVARYSIDSVRVELRETVKRRESKLPYGEVLREVRSVPRLAVMISPANAIVPLSAPTTSVAVEVSLLHNAEAATMGQVALRMPAGWTSEPVSQPFSFARAGERAAYRFMVQPGAIDARAYTIEAVAAVTPHKGAPYKSPAAALNGPPYEYREGYEVIDHRDLEIRYLYRASTAEVRGVDVTTVDGLQVGYVMGIGDQVPLGLRQLGAEVTLLGDRDLASADLSIYDTIMTGTRAYAVRDDLKTYNQRLIDYVKAGGNMIVLYNTQEFVPNQFGPFPGELPRSAEEVSEEDSPVTILAPTQQSFMWPNQITAADFDGWVEQRGSKFFTKWDAAYTPMISTFDKGQPPQSGGWLTAKVGEGNWTYFAYALHRQLPYGVAGAYRITANLLALGKQP